MRLFALVCLSFRLFAGAFEDIEPSTSEEILSLHSGLLVDGYVSASSGQLVVSETDLSVKGAQDLCLKRVYIAPIIKRYTKDKAEDLYFALDALRVLL